MKNLSFWQRDTFLSPREIIILGSGIVGLSAAIQLKLINRQIKVTIVDESPFPGGASTKNAGFACIGSPSELIDDLQHLSEKEVYEIVALRWQGLKRLRTLLGDDAIQYCHTFGYEVFTAAESELFETCNKNLARLNEALHEITGIENAFETDYQIASTFSFKNLLPVIRCKTEGTLHPGLMIQALMSKARQLDIEFLTGIRVTNLQQHQGLVELKTNQEFSLYCKQMLLCTNGFTQQLLSEVPVIPARNQVFVTSPIPNLPFNGCFHRYKGYYYFRNIGDRVLIGGARHLFNTREQTDIQGITEDIKFHLADFLHTHILPDWDGNFEYSWSGTLGVGTSKEPIVSQHDQGIFLAVRMGGMGVAIGSEIGYRAANMLIQAQ